MERSVALNVLLNRLAVTKEHMMITNYALVKVASDQTPSWKISHHRAITNHAIKRNAENAIRLLYTHLNEYLKAILTEMYIAHPLEIANKAQGTIPFHRIIKLGSYEAISQYIVDSIFRSLEAEKNTRLLIKKLLAKTGVQIPADIIDEAIIYLDMRHLIVHNASIIDEHFAQIYAYVYGDNPFYKNGAKLPISVGLAKKAIEAIKKLCFAIDRGLIDSRYIVSVEPTAKVVSEP